MPSIGKIWVDIGGDTTGLDRSLSKAVTNIQRVGSAFATAGRTMTLGVTVPIVAVGALAIKASMDFETAFAGVRKTVDGTADDFTRLRKGILDMSTTMPETASNIAKVVETAGQLGIKTKDLLEFTKTMVMVGKTTDVTADEAATGFARIANIMKLPEDQVYKLASAFTFLSNEGASTGAEIIEMGQRIAGAGHAVGLSAPEVLAFAAGLSDLGLKSEAGGTAFSRMIITMSGAVAGLKPTQEQLDKISEAQRNVRDTGEQMVPAQQGVRNAIEAVGTASRGVRDAHEGVAQAQRQARDANERLSQAYRDLAQAQRDQRQASLDSRRETLSVAEAQQGLREVQAGAANQVLELRQAEQSLKEARSRGPKDIADAEYALAKIRNQAKPDAQSLRDAERNLAKVRSEDHSLEIAQAEQRLLEVRTRAPRYTLDLANAQLRLEETSLRVGDASKRQAENLQGANKSVRDAKEGVQDASLGIRDANERVVDSQRGLRDSNEAVIQAQINARNASEKYSDAQKALGLAQDQATGKLKTFAEVAGMTPDAFAALFKKDPAGAINAFVGGLQRISKEGGNLFPIFEKLELNDIRVRDELLRMAVGAVDFSKKLAETNNEFNVGTYLTQKYADVTDTAANKLQLQRNEINKNLIALGDQLVPILLDVSKNMQPMIQAFATMTEKFAGLPKPVQEGIVGFLGFAAVLGPIAMVVGNLTRAFGAIQLIMGSKAMITGIMAMRSAFMSLGAALLTPPLGIIIALVAIGVALYIFRDQIKDALGVAFEFVIKKAGEAKDALVGAFNKVFDFLKGNWKTIALLISGPFLPLVALATDAFGIRSAIVNAFTGLVSIVGNVVSSIVGAIVGAFNSAASAVGSAVSSVVNAIRNNFNAETMGKVFGFFLFLPVRIFRIEFEHVSAAVRLFFGTTLPSIITNIIPAISAAVYSVGKAIVTTLVNAITSLPGFIANAAVQIATATYNLGRMAVNGIISGITAYLSLVKTFWTVTLPGIITGAVTLLTNAGITAGKAIINGIWSGITSVISMIIAAPTLIKNAFVDGFNAISHKFAEIGQAIVKGVWAGITSLGGWLIGQVTDFFGGIVGAAKDAAGIHSPSTVFAEIGSNMVKGLALGIRSEPVPTIPTPQMAGDMGGYSLPNVAQGRGMQGMTGSSTGGGGGSFGRAVAGSSSEIGGKAGIEISGPVTVQNIGKRKDAKGTLGALGYGIRAQITNAGGY